MALQLFSARHHQPPQRRSVLHCAPALRLPHRLLLQDQPVFRCSDGPGLNGSAVIRWCLKRGRSAPCSRSPSATSVPLGQDSFSPGAIRSQAEGGNAPEQQIPNRTEGENTPIHARVRHGVRACPANSCKTRQDLGAKVKAIILNCQFSNKSEQFLVNIDMKISILDKALSVGLFLVTLN